MGSDTTTTNRTGMVPLRASCDRCRALKLRCVPSSEAPTDPCQRCLRAKATKSCVFSQRSRTGRSARSGSTASNSNNGDEPHKKTSSMPHRVRESSMGGVPGTSTFVLSIPTASTTKTSKSKSDSPPPSAGSETSQTATVTSAYPLISGDVVPDLWSPGSDIAGDATAFSRFLRDVSTPSDPPNYHHNHAQFGPESALLLSASSASSEMGDGMLPIMESFDPTTDYAHEFSFPDFIPSVNTSSTAMDLDPFSSTTGSTDLNTTQAASSASSPEYINPLIELTTLLAEMSQYENRLSSFPSTQAHSLDDYPIGDALFISQRFYAIIADLTHSSASSSSSFSPNSNTMPTPTSSSPSSPHHHSYSPHHARGATSTSTLELVLPILTVYLTLTRIYSSIFTFLLEQLSSSAPHTASCPRQQQQKDISHSYRGLRLGQLSKEMCLCAGWDPAPRVKNAVAMLLGSLGGAESLLSLPGDVRVVKAGSPNTHSRASSSFSRGVGGGGGSSSNSNSNSKEKGRSDDSTAKHPENHGSEIFFDEKGRLYKAVREQARELRDKVEEVEVLLKGIL
ncbi:hypothetical protein QBC44DRAFT_388112 [Cladorrhinum sp. PSN332]|nr:hypothetical protein QBC44DRAFT_388112 [Cladorrhinum sp. PSN332]